MCGITGLISNELSAGEMHSIITEMNNQLVHRGPDASGIWIKSTDGISLGHRRLSILDLTSDGNQPKQSINGRFVISFNGEIYNYNELKEELVLDGYNSGFRGHSDTEVILASFETWGIECSVRKFAGMFVIAVWDCKEKQLYLIRDRIGEKPLYYGYIDKAFVFASELKAIKKYPKFKFRINRSALAQYFQRGYVPCPLSIYEGIYKLQPGSILKVNVKHESSMTQTTYWSPEELTDNKQEPLSLISDNEVIDNLEHLIARSVKNQMLNSDVPVGAFLSGGIDSSAVVSLMQSQSLKPIKTFSIGFTEEMFNEATFAKEISNYLGTEHYELYVTANECMEVIPALPLIYDEPFADSSQIPTLLVSKLAKKHVKVALSGDGGDEIFGGYGRYLFIKKTWDKMKLIPTPLRSLIASACKKIPVEHWDSVFKKINFKNLNGDRIHKLLEIIPVRNKEMLYFDFTSIWKKPLSSILLNSEEHYQNYRKKIEHDNFIHWMMLFDTISYLPDDILVKVDRASMSVGLETRIPLLDHRIVEFVWKLPISMKMRGNISKWALREMLYRYVPESLIDRPKKGFSIPLGDWLRGPLKEWAEELINEQRIKSDGILNYESVRLKWNEHLSGTRNWQEQLWSILMFQSWLENQSKEET